MMMMGSGVSTTDTLDLRGEDSVPRTPRNLDASFDESVAVVVTTWRQPAGEERESLSAGRARSCTLVAPRRVPLAVAGRVEARPPKKLNPERHVRGGRPASPGRCLRPD